MYFGQYEEDLIKKWCEAKTDKEQYFVYKRLTPVLKHLIKNVIQKYFTLNDRETNDSVLEMVNHLYLNFHKWDKKKGNAFTFCTVLVKNKLRNKYILKSVQNTDNDYLYENDVPEKENDDIDYREIVSKHLRKKIKQAEHELINLKKSLTQRKGILIQTIDIGYLLLQYVMDYEPDQYTYENMFDYVYHNYNFDKDWVVERSMRYYINYCVYVRTFNEKPDYKASAEKGMIEKYGYLQDDHTPDKSLDDIYISRRFIRNNYKDKLI